MAIKIVHIRSTCKKAPNKMHCDHMFMDGNFTEKIKQDIKRTTVYFCCYCGKGLEFSEAHSTPVHGEHYNG